ncbi:glycosyl transferase family 2 [Trypanosoma rangeli]|uniref:Glycosyl transferase family 2 n=1 Tax=Trypanosoma rangeli TaxID=5698 RepID=A0A3R7N290_TRYRA|nr:glycosyl transferase family 2 [Trypanosoma rangeli]RNE98865.1 glycosyl transferase family 2 [Trypanosoma rangeli]|eukprot:RNE98865.1 glycosyl transferase family 2 [Trypanosoma rangeli]
MVSMRWRRRRSVLLPLALLYVLASAICGGFYTLIALHPGSREGNLGALHLYATDAFPENAAPPEDTSSWTRISFMGGIKADAFYRLRSVPDGRWLGHSSDGIYSGVLNKTLGLVSGLVRGTYAVQAWSSLFLSVHLDGSVGMDRSKARSAELWSFKFVPGAATVALWSVSRRRFVRIAGDRLMCDAKKLEGATHWILYAEPNKACHSPTPDADWSTVARACWKFESLAPRISMDPKTVLFGTLKPLKSLEPNKSDMHDPFLIANRTLFNWALLKGIQPVVFTDNALDHALIEQINQDLAVMAIGRRIDVIKNFEIHGKFGLPTYRGLFLRVLTAYPNAQIVMYSNMDILYARSVLETMEAVRYYFCAREERKGTFKGWFAVGRRTNFDISLNWSLGTNWEKDVEVSFGTPGVLFQSLSEDYFAMSRSMFDWKNIPDFVVGGTGFDNWLTTQAVARARAGRALAVEATLTLTAIHQNHGEDLKASHRHPKSRYNNALAQRAGGWALGHTTDAPLLTVRHFGGEVLVLNKSAVLLL